MIYRKYGPTQYKCDGSMVTAVTNFTNEYNIRKYKNDSPHCLDDDYEDSTRDEFNQAYNEVLMRLYADMDTEEDEDFLEDVEKEFLEDIQNYKHGTDGL